MWDTQTQNLENDKKWFFDYFFDPDELPKMHFVNKQINHKWIESHLYNWIEFKNVKNKYKEINEPVIKSKVDPYHEYNFDKDNNVVRITHIFDWKIKKTVYPLIPPDILANLPEKWLLYQRNIYWEITSIYEIKNKAVSKIFVKRPVNEL